MSQLSARIVKGTGASHRPLKGVRFHALLDAYQMHASDNIISNARVVTFASREDVDYDVQSKRDRRIVLQHRVSTITEYMEQRAKGKWITGRKISDSTGIKAVIVARVLTYMRETLRTVESEGKPGDALVWRLK